ncbi:MAG: hypothetical protein K0S74_952 [Chlamydiales bacterium]|jgi:tetratricopeptide (TPR) repeat protein|nr:hypothetical protein [Chlamydiales bacterium]
MRLQGRSRMKAYGAYSEAHSYSDKPLYYDQIQRVCLPAIQQFEHIIKKHILLHSLFWIAGVVQSIALIITALFYTHSTWLALQIPLFCFTVFAYLVVRVYAVNRKTELLTKLHQQYTQACRRIIQYQEGVAEHHIAIAAAATLLAEKLHDKEYTIYQPNNYLKFLSSLLEKVGCWLHWADIHLMKELLLQYAIQEHIKLVKCEPTRLESHAALANAYNMLSTLYIYPSKLEGYDENRWFPSERYSEAMYQQFFNVAQKAIEELKILDHYAPDQPWIHAQLAYIYNDLQMVEEEIAEYEKMRMLLPHDKEVLFKLGVLYFQQGYNAKGLEVYEEIKKTNYKKAEDLIWFYGSSRL